MKSNLFGKLLDGREVSLYSLKNDLGAQVNIINFGEIVTNIIVPVKNGKFDDVVL